MLFSFANLRYFCLRASNIIDLIYVPFDYLGNHELGLFYFLVLGVLDNTEVFIFSFLRLLVLLNFKIQKAYLMIIFSGDLIFH